MQVVVDFLENEAIADDVFVKITLDSGVLIMDRGKRLPEDLSSWCLFDPKQGQGTGVMMGVVELVHGLVREQASIGIDAAGGESTARGDEHPQVGIAGNTHQERSQPMEGGDSVIILPVKDDKITSG
jgi:hypothetical protein